MPLMIEPLVFRPNAQAGGYMVDGDLKKIMPLVRQAVELGADIISTYMMEENLMQRCGVLVPSPSSLDTCVY
jgi:fructose-bisphosphate aldolase, class I